MTEDKRSKKVLKVLSHIDHSMLTMQELAIQMKSSTVKDLLEDAAKADEVLHVEGDELLRLIWDRLGLGYQYQRFGVRNIVERFFGYLKQRTTQKP